MSFFAVFRRPLDGKGFDGSAHRYEFSGTPARSGEHCTKKGAGNALPAPFFVQYGVFGNFRLSYRSGFSFLPSLQSANDQDRSRAEERAENVQPRLRRAGEKPRQPLRDGQAQRRRLPPVCPERKKMMPRQRTAGKKSGNACASSWRHKSPWIPFARISVPDHGLDLECSVENPCARCSCLMIQP